MRLHDGDKDLHELWPVWIADPMPLYRQSGVEADLKSHTEVQAALY
jgi:hypothetical protein